MRFLQHNEPNPFLVAAREEGADHWLEQIEYYGDSLSGGWIDDMKVLPAHIPHALSVLRRLPALKAAAEAAQ